MVELEWRRWVLQSWGSLRVEPDWRWLVWPASLVLMLA